MICFGTVGVERPVSGQERGKAPQPEMELKIVEPQISFKHGTETRESRVQ